MLLCLGGATTSKVVITWLELLGPLNYIAGSQYSNTWTARPKLSGVPITLNKSCFRAFTNVPMHILTSWIAWLFLGDAPEAGCKNKEGPACSHLNCNARHLQGASFWHPQIWLQLNANELKNRAVLNKVTWWFTDSGVRIPSRKSELYKNKMQTLQINILTVFSVAVCRRNLTTGYSKISGKVHCKYCFYANCHWITNKIKKWVVIYLSEGHQHLVKY